MYHCSFILGDTLYSAGGLTFGSESLDELIGINLERMEVSVPKLSSSVRFPYHGAAATCFYAQRYSEGVHLSAEKLFMAIDWAIASYYIQHEGVYFFGGIDPETQRESDRLMVLKPLQDSEISFEVKFPETKGVGPRARCMHTLTYFQAQNMLLVYGGKAQPDQELLAQHKQHNRTRKKRSKKKQRRLSNDSCQASSAHLTPSQQEDSSHQSASSQLSRSYRSKSIADRSMLNSYQSGVLSDLCILNLHSMTWVGVRFSSDSAFLQPCFNHAATMIGSKLLILGGLDHHHAHVKHFMEIIFGQSKQDYKDLEAILNED